MPSSTHLTIDIRSAFNYTYPSPSFVYFFLGWGYTDDRRADKYPYLHDRRADKDPCPHDRNVIDDLCSLIKLCFAFIMFNFST